MGQPKHVVRSKIAAFRRGGFNVSIVSSPSLLVRVEDAHRRYLNLVSAEALGFVAVARKLAELHALSLSDAYRLQAVRALQAHLQIELPLETSPADSRDQNHSRVVQ